MRVTITSYYESYQRRVYAKTVIRIRIINSFYICIYLHLVSLIICSHTVLFNTNNLFIFLSCDLSLSLSILPLQLIQSNIRYTLYTRS